LISLNYRQKYFCPVHYLVAKDAKNYLMLTVIQKRFFVSLDELACLWNLIWNSQWLHVCPQGGEKRAFATQWRRYRFGPGGKT